MRGLLLFPLAKQLATRSHVPTHSGTQACQGAWLATPFLYSRVGLYNSLILRSLSRKQGGYCIYVFYLSIVPSIKLTRSNVLLPHRLSPALGHESCTRHPERCRPRCPPKKCYDPPGLGKLAPL